MTLGFLTAFATQKVRSAGQAATTALVAFDPKGATEAQLDLMDQQLDQLGQRVAATQRQYSNAKLALEAAQRLNTQRLTAAEALQGDPSKQASLEKLLDIIEQAQPDLSRLKQDESEVKEYLADLQAAYSAAAEKLKGARHELEQAQRGMDRAHVAEERARNRADAAAVTAGIRDGGNTLNTALDAMRRKAAAAEDAAAAADLKASTLAPQDHERDDPSIAAAMAEASGKPAKPQSAAERLAALKAA